MITKEVFISKFNIICQDLKGREINDVFHSVGSMVEFGFGEDWQVTLGNAINQRKSRVIWLDQSEWRITRHGQYITGSKDDQEKAHKILCELIERRFLSMKISSHLMDLAIEFDDGYTIYTFSCVFEDPQWTFFYFNEELSVDVSTDQERKEVYELAKAFDIPNVFTSLQTDVDGLTIAKTEWRDTERVIFHVRHDLALILDMWAWRLLKNGEWITGCFVGGWDPNENCFALDEKQIKRCLHELEGKVIKRIEVANNMLDARFYIGDEYILETFVCCKEGMNRWGIYPGVPEPSFYAPPDSVFQSTQH